MSIEWIKELLEPSAEPKEWSGIAPRLHAVEEEHKAWSPLEEVCATLAQRVIGSVCGRYRSGVSAAIERDRMCRETVTRGESLPSDVDEIGDAIEEEAFDLASSRAALLDASRRFAAASAAYDAHRNRAASSFCFSPYDPIIPEMFARDSCHERARARRDASPPSRP